MHKKLYVAVAVLLAVFISVSSILAQETDFEQKKTLFMFVQNAHDGTFVPVPHEDNLYILTLNGVALQTIYFSGRPERIVGQTPMQKFLDGLNFSADNPPNAAVQILEGKEDADVVVVELFDPVYDAEKNTLQYTARVLTEPNLSYAVFNEQHDGAIPKTFGAVSLFIDDCSDAWVYCIHEDVTECGVTTCCRCYDWVAFQCTYEGDCCSEARCDRKCERTFGPGCKFARGRLGQP